MVSAQAEPCKHAPDQERIRGIKKRLLQIQGLSVCAEKTLFCVYFSSYHTAHHEELRVVIHGLLSVDVDNRVQELVQDVQFSRVRDDC